MTANGMPNGLLTIKQTVQLKFKKVYILVCIGAKCQRLLRIGVVNKRRKQRLYECKWILLVRLTIGELLFNCLGGWRCYPHTGVLDFIGV